MSSAFLLRHCEDDQLAAIRAVLSAYRSTSTHITEEQITAAWAEYEAVRAALRQGGAMPVSQQNPDGSWSEAVPLGPQGPVAKVEFWLRARGHRRLAAVLAWWDERGLGG